MISKKITSYILSSVLATTLTAYSINLVYAQTSNRFYTPSNSNNSNSNTVDINSNNNNNNNSNNSNNFNNPDKLGVFLDKLSDTSHATLDAASSVTTKVLNTAQEVVGSALGLLGVPYRYGGNTAEQGLDCSGFVKLVFSKTLGIVLPRRADEMGKLGLPVNHSDLQPGDLVFFNTMHRVNSHVGIYIGEDEFVHAPSTGKNVRVDKLNSVYWSKHFEGGKRIVQLDNQNN